MILALSLLACTGPETANDTSSVVDTGEVCDLVWIWQRDADGDGWGTATEEVVACAQPEGFVRQMPGDCNDADASIHPGAEEVFSDGVDSDCGATPGDDDDNDDQLDADRGGEDCNDTNPLVFAGAVEICGNKVDDDCEPSAAACHFLASALDPAVAEVELGCTSPLVNWRRGHACTEPAAVRVLGVGSSETLPVAGAPIGSGYSQLFDGFADYYQESLLVRTNAGHELWTREVGANAVPWHAETPSSTAVTAFVALATVGATRSWLDLDDSGPIVRSVDESWPAPSGTVDLLAHSPKAGSPLILVGGELSTLDGSGLGVTGSLVVDGVGPWSDLDATGLSDTDAGAFHVVLDLSSAPSVHTLTGGGEDWSRGCVMAAVTLSVVACDLGSTIAVWQTPIDGAALSALPATPPTALYTRVGVPPEPPALALVASERGGPDLVIAEQDRLLKWVDAGE